MPCMHNIHGPHLVLTPGCSPLCDSTSVNAAVMWLQVFTSRAENVGHHRTIQTAVRGAVSRALRLAALLEAPHTSAAAASGHPAQPAAAASRLELNSSSGSNGSSGVAGNGSGPQPATEGTECTAPQPPYTVRLEALSLSRFQLPLEAAVTTRAGGATRDGLLLELQWRAASSRSGRALGEISLLPGA